MLILKIAVGNLSLLIQMDEKMDFILRGVLV